MRVSVWWWQCAHVCLPAFTRSRCLTPACMASPFPRLDSVECIVLARLKAARYSMTAALNPAPSSPQWDVSFWAERLKEAQYSISDEELRPYFALPNVLDGLFKARSVEGWSSVGGVACVP